MTEELKPRICMTCKTEFKGEAWKKQCLDCYRNFKGLPRFKIVCRWKSGVIFSSHPDVTQDEADEWIKKRWPDELNWGARDVSGKRKVWWNNQNDN
jgi:hypothetical protein